MLVYLFSNPTQCPHAHRALGRWVKWNGVLHYISLKEQTPGYQKDTHGTAEDSQEKISEILGHLCEEQTNRISLENFDSIREAIRGTESLFFAGGDSLVYLEKLRATQGVGGSAFDLLKKTGQQNPSKLIMGASAGAMIFGKSVEAFAAWSYLSKQRDRRKTQAEAEATALGFVNAQIIPHYGSAKYPKELVDKVLDIYFEKETPPQDTKLVLLEENAAITLDTTRNAIGMMGGIHLRDRAGQRLLAQKELLELLPGHAPSPQAE